MTRTKLDPHIAHRVEPNAMTRTLSLPILLIIATSLIAATPIADETGPSPDTASGEGSMSFGDDGHGRAYFRFSLRRDGSGSLMFAGEDHHERFPDVVITLGTVESSTFDRSAVKFTGPGKLHDDIVQVTAVARDNTPQGEPDRFSIWCNDADGEVLFQADGALFRGDIAVESP